jgi:hypothetical protein
MRGKLSHCKACISASFDHFVPISLLLYLFVMDNALLLQVAVLSINLLNLLASC